MTSDATHSVKPAIADKFEAADAPAGFARTAYSATYCSLVAASVVLPSAKLYSFNVKITLAFALLALGVWLWWRLLLDRSWSGRISRRYVAILGYIGAVIAMWSFVAIKNDFNPLPEVRSLLAPLILLATYHPALVPKRALLDVYAAAAIIYAAAKVTTVWLAYTNTVPIETLTEFASSIFHVQLVTGPTCMRDLYKIVMVNDLTLVVFPFLLLQARYRRAFLFFGLGLVMLALMLSYSRYLMLAFVAISLVTALSAESARAKLVIAISLLAAWTVVYALVGSCFLARFTSGFDEAQPESSANVYADQIRRSQFEHFKELIVEKPLMGHGVGSYHRDYIRLPLVPYSYELQLLSFVFKLGLIGFSLLSVGVLGFFSLVFARDVSAWAAVAILGGGGLTNPFYESSAFGVAIVLTIVTFSHWTNSSSIEASVRRPTL